MLIIGSSTKQSSSFRQKWLIFDKLSHMSFLHWLRTNLNMTWKLCKVCGCYAVTYLNWTPIYDWGVFR